MKNKERVFSVRLSEIDHLRFVANAKKYGNPSDVIRELITAFNERRLIVRPPANKPPSMSKLWSKEDDEQDY